VLTNDPENPQCVVRFVPVIARDLFWQTAALQAMREDDRLR